ncbi:MAG: N-acetylmuramoyl-L-alanine amidase [Chloroflexota bacterium]
MQAPATTFLSANWSTPRAGAPIVAIVAHATVGTNSIDFLRRGGDLPDGSDRRVSIHVLFDKAGRRYVYLPDSVGANHAGFSTLTINGQTFCRTCPINANQSTLGFEIENLQDGRDPYTEAQLLSMGWQINEWRRIHGPLPIVRHADIDPTRRSDPIGLSVAQMEEWARRAAGEQPPRDNGLQRFVVIPDSLAIVREGPGTSFPESLDGQSRNLTRLPGGTEVTVDRIVRGEEAFGDTRWAHLASDLGFIHILALEPA